jgi:hypothetical protein
LEQFSTHPQLSYLLHIPAFPRKSYFIECLG